MQTSRLYHQLCNLLGQSSPWADLRHLQALIWMVIGVLCSEGSVANVLSIHIISRLTLFFYLLFRRSPR